MITVGYSTRTHNPEFIEYLKKSSGFKKIEVIEKINNGDKSLSEVYNEILSESKTDIVVLCHDDIYFDTNAWYSKLIKHLQNICKCWEISTNSKGRRDSRVEHHESIKTVRRTPEESQRVEATTPCRS
jgi:hypothetical protein